MKATLSEKGQVTIPKPIRDKLGLRSGSVIEFHIRGAALIAKKADSEEDPVLAVTGIVRLAESVDGYLATTRGVVE